MPTNNDNVVITNSFTVYVTSQVTSTGLNVTVQKGGTLDLQTATATFATLSSLSGQGTLRIAAPYFPAVTTNNFGNANTGTVEFYNWPAGPTALPVGQYNNLRLLNKTATPYVVQLDNDLTLNGSLTLIRTNTTVTTPLVSFTLGKTATARTLNVLGDITVGAGTVLGVSAVTLPAPGTPAVQTFHTINASGNFINNGTVNLHVSTDDTQVALLNFTSSTDANFACNGPTDLDILKVDKGNDSKVLLNVTSANYVGTNNLLAAQGNLRLNHVGNGDILALVNGITKLNSNVYLTKIHNGAPSPANLTNSAGWFQLGSTTTSPTLWINNATVLNDNASLFVVYGIYRISGGGKLSSENDGGMVIREDAQVLIEGGTTIVNKFRPSSTAATHRGSFTMTGGIFKCTGKYSSSYDDQFSRFAIPYTTQAFRMSGGSIEVYQPGASGDGFLHIGVNPNNAVVSGGIIKLFVPDITNNNTCKILSTAPLWDLSISKPSTTAAAANSTSKAILSAMTLAFTGATTTIQPLTVLHDFTINGANAVTFDAANQDVTIQGSLTTEANGTYLPGTNTTIFSGGLDQLLTNNGTIGTTANVGTFNNWTVNKSGGTLSLAGNSSFVVSGTLSLLSGVLNDGGKTISAKGNVVNSASHSSGGGSGSIVLAGAGGQIVSGDGTGVFGNLKLNSTATAGTVAATLTANMSVASTLTMQSTHILAIGANRLSLTNVNSSTTNGALILGPGNSYSTSCFIQTAGNQSDLGLQKTYGKGDSFIFPVGTGVGTTARYAPATIELQLATSVLLDKFGQVSVSPTSSRNPFVTGTTNSLAYYWKVRSVGFGPIPVGAVYETFTMTNADATIPTSGSLNNYVPARYQPVAWTKYSTGDMSIGTTGTIPISFIAFKALDTFEGEFTAGYPAAFGTIISFYSIKNGNWETPGTWSTAGYNGTAGTTAIPGAGNPVFIGSADNRAYHTIMVTVANAKSGSLVIDRGSTLDVQTLTGHNFGALPDSKVGGSGRLRVSSSAATPTFPGGDFGSFIQYGGGTVEYYTSGVDFTLPMTSNSGSLTLNQYRNLWLSAATARTITLPNQNLRIYSQLKTGTQSGTGIVMMNTGANGNIRVDSLLNIQAGIFRYPNTTARQVAVDTNVQVDATATFDVATSTVTAVANTLAIGNALTDSPMANSLTNNGTLDFKVGTATVALTFTGSNNTNLTGPTGTLTDLNTLTVNKGTGRTATLNVDVAGTFSSPTNNWLTLTNGTLNFAKTNGTLTIHDLASSYLITDNAGLNVNASGATVTVATNTNAASDLKLAGLIQVLQGTLNVGTPAGTGNDLEYASAGAPGLKVSGTGNLYVNGQIRRTVNNLDGSLRYDQSGGTVNIDGFGATAAQSNERGLFEVQGTGSIFRMSGGTLNLHRSNGRPTFTADLYLAPDSTVVTGGTVVLGNPTTASISSNVIISASSTVPLYNLRVESGASGNTNTGLLAGVIPLTLKGSLTIGNDFSFFNANGLGLNIYQSLNNNNTSVSTALNAGGFQPITTAQTTTFLGGIVTQFLTGTTSNLTVFGSLVMNTPQTNGTLQLSGNTRIAGNLTLTKGTLNDNGQTMTVLGDVLNSATHTSSGTGSIILAGTTNQNIGGNGTGSFGNLTLNNSLGSTTTANQEITKVLTLTTGIFTIGSNLLLLSNPATGAVAGTFDATHFIRTNGIVADLGVRKSYPSGALNFTFPIGAGTTYTPVIMNVTANSAAGTLTVQPIDLAHPSTTGSGTNKISFYWKVSSSNNFSPKVDQNFTYGSNDVIGDENLYKLGRFYKGAWVPVGGIATSTVTPATHTLNNPGYSGTASTIDGDYTGGDVSEFQAVPTFYSRNSTASQPSGSPWTSASSWTNNPDGSDPAPTFNSYPTLASPAVISSGHLITTTTGSLGAATLRLDGTLDLGPNAANNFNTVNGTGTMRIGSALFPAGNYATFVAPGGGTVDYSGAVQLPARDTYNNLTFSGGNGKQLSNLDLNINGALTVAANTTVDNPTSQNINLNSATSGATVSGTFNLNDGALTTGAFLATNAGGTLNLGAGAVNIGTTLANGGILNNGTGNVAVGTAFNNSGTYNANVKTGNLTVGTTFANSGTYTAGVGTLLINSNFSNVANGTFTAAAGDVNVLGTFLNAGTYTAPDATNKSYLRVTGDFTNLSTGYFTPASSIVILHSNFSNSGIFDISPSSTPGNSLVVFTADINHTLTGTTAFYDLQKAGANNLTLGANTNVTVTHILTMQNGLIYTGTSNTISLSYTAAQPIVGASPATYVAGRLAMSLPNTTASIRVFPLGLGNRYRPVTITPQSTSTNPIVLVEIINSAPAGTIDGSLSNMSANRYYRIQLLSGTLAASAIQLSFNTDVEDENVTVPGNLRVARTTATGLPTSSNNWSNAGGAGVFSPADPRGYTTSAAAIINSTSFFALASTNYNDNKLTGIAPLPVKLMQFSAVRQGSTVRVAWATASEQNSAYFVVQRSTDGRTFADVQRVAAQGTTTNRHDYATLDTQPLAGLSYYRLHQVDIDGMDDYSPVVAVRFDGVPATPTLVAYPNPATKQGFQLLTTKLGTTGGTVQVFDNVGRLVLTHVAAAAEAAIEPTQPLASGMYFVTWQTADGLKLSTKVVVE
ncbi:T9SS type A sorting domain-containing protein [Hymenobacter sp. UV11]|uniref:T9SS type A sorting domain-containing protein n=1 Tax=Hymenobacter sp. UV11 TaxID=1849735 RepID=UPI00105C0906|nr:T9SS type A sorting domain-containing protein [Hymenobacter sp. UV11]TFZ65964.1 T9SS type A sorting domain-containing protein [Hymenobacter sp. UV11]